MDIRRAGRKRDTIKATLEVKGKPIIITIKERDLQALLPDVVDPEANPELYKTTLWDVLDEMAQKMGLLGEPLYSLTEPTLEDLHYTGPALKQYVQRQLQGKRRNRDFNTLLEHWIKQHPGRKLTISDITVFILKQAYPKLLAKYQDPDVYRIFCSKNKKPQLKSPDFRAKRCLRKALEALSQR